MCPICGCLGPLHGPEFHLIKGGICNSKRIECIFIVYPNESKVFKLLNIKKKHIIIERSVKFDEHLQEVELVKEKTAKFPSYSTEYLDDEIGGDNPDLDPMIYDISV